MIYYNEYGRTFFKEHCRKNASPANQPASGSEDLFDLLVLHGRLAESDFDINSIFQSRAQLREHIAGLRESAVEPTYPQFQKLRHSLPLMSRTEKKSYWIIQNGRCLKIADLVYSVLTRAATQRCSLAELLEGFNPSLRERLLEHLRLLEKKGYVATMKIVPSATNMAGDATAAAASGSLADNLTAALASHTQAP